MINDDKTARSAWPRAVVGTPWQIITLPVIPVFLIVSHLFPSFRLNWCFSLHVRQRGGWGLDSSGWHVRNEHTALTDGAAQSVWQLTLLVVRLNPYDHCSLPSPPPTVLCGLKMPIHIPKHSDRSAIVRQMLSIFSYWTLSYLYAQISASPPKHHSNSKTKASKYKVLCISCHKRDLF